jgi:hypothetical protein
VIKGNDLSYYDQLNDSGKCDKCGAQWRYGYITVDCPCYADVTPSELECCTKCFNILNSDIPEPLDKVKSGHFIFHRIRCSCHDEDGE